MTEQYESPLAAFDEAQIAVMDAIRARNIAVGRTLPLAQYDDGLAKARARMEAAVTLIESTGSKAPAPFAGYGYKPTSPRPVWTDSPRLDTWQCPRAVDRARV